MCSIALGLFIEFFLRQRERDNKISRVIELKSRVGCVSGNTTIFFFRREVTMYSDSTNVIWDFYSTQILQ